MVTVKANEDNDKKYMQGLPTYIPGGRNMPTDKNIPLKEQGENNEEMEYFTE